MPRKKARIQKFDNSFYSTENQENNGTEIRTILCIFRESDDSHAHDRLITQLKIEFYDKLNIDEFSEDFFNCCRFILAIEDRVKSDIPLKFVVKFIIFCITKSVTDEAKESSLNLLRSFIKFITWHHDVQHPHVRFNTVRAIKHLLAELTDEIEIADTYYSKIQDAIVKRFWDIKSFIRAEAAQASTRLQTPSDRDCVIVISLIHLCKYDSSHTVRLAAMQSLAITTKTLPVIIAQCRDVNDLVRKKSFDLLIKWKILKPLTVSKRLQIMESGLTDKSEIVKHSCVELLKVWWSSSNCDPIALLKRLDVENMEEATELTLRTLFQNLNDEEMKGLVNFISEKMDDKLLVLDTEMCAEMAFLWKNLIQFLSEKQAENSENLEKIVPSVLDYESYLRRLFNKPMEQVINREVDLEESLESYTIIKYLLPIVKHMDIYDEHNRTKMIDMIKWALSSPAIPFNYVNHLMKLLVHLESNNEKICNVTVELINELLFSEGDSAPDRNTNQSVHCEQATVQDPTVSLHEEKTVLDPIVVNHEAIRRKKLEMAEVDVRMNELNESINNCIQNENYFDNLTNMLGELRVFKETKRQLKEQIDSLAVLENKVIASEVEPVVEDEPMDQIEQIKEEVSKSQPWMAKGMEKMITKANMMTIAMIQECNMLWTLPASLRALFENVILISVQHTDLCVRQKAIMSMGLCCLLDKDLAIRFHKLFIKSLEMDHDSVREISVKSLIDIFIRFGIEPFQESIIATKEASKMCDSSENSSVKQESTFASETTKLTEEEYNKCTTELMTPIIDLLNSESTDIQTTVAIGLSKLLYNHKLMSSKLLSRLLLLWFNPITEDNLKLRQYLAAFFTNFSLMSSDNQEALTNCFLITMRTLCKAPANSPLLKIDFNNVIDFFERVTDSKYLIENRTNTVEGHSKLDTFAPLPQCNLDNPCHDSLAVTVSNQILNAPLSTEVKYYVPMLLRLRLSPSNIDVMRTLMPMVAIMMKKIKDKKSVLALEKFYNSLSKRVEEANDFAAPADQNDTDTLVNETISDIVNATPFSKPSLLEMGTDGKKKNATYIGRRINKNAVDDTASQISSINLDSSEMDTTLSDTVSKTQPPLLAADIDSSKQMPPPSMTANEFRKKANVRLTRSASRRDSGASSISSIGSDVSTGTINSNVRVTRQSSIKKK